MRKSIFVVILAVCILLFSMVVNADSNLGTTLSADKTSAKPGDTIQVSVNVSGLSGITNGINAFGLTFGYDKNVFETVTSADTTGQNGWSNPTYNDQTGAMVTDNSSFMKTDGAIMTITLKVKAGIADTTSNISITGISASNGDADISSADSKLAITVKNDTNSNTNTTTPPTDSDTDANAIFNDIPASNTNTNVNSVTNTSKNNTAQNNTVSKLPYTGAGSIIYILVAVTGITGLISYVRYKGLKIK